MAQKVMYPGMVNSPETTITNGISESDTIIYVLDPARVPTPPNLMTLGTGTNAETVKVTEINDSAITVERGFQGIAKSWPAGTVIARNFTEYDYNALKENIEDYANHKGNIVAHGLDMKYYPQRLYVSMNGNDETGDGSLSNPYRTLQKAIDLIPIGGAGEIRIAGTSEQSPYVIDSEVIISRRLVYFFQGPCYIQVHSSGQITLFNATLLGFYGHNFYIDGALFQLGGGNNTLNFGGYEASCFYPLSETADVTVFQLARGTANIDSYARPVMQTINGFRVRFLTIEGYTGSYKVFAEKDTTYRSGFILFRARELIKDEDVDWGFNEYELGGGVSLFSYD